MKEMKNEDKILEKIKRLFWDVNKEDVGLKAHHAYIIRRILDYGEIEDIKWMLSTYSKEEIVKVIKKSRGLSRKSAYFWSAYFGIPQKEIACLIRPYLKRLKPL